jgi:hypothetical protein
VLPDIALGLPRTATAPTSFDPWDAPYFGAATYFNYQATLWYAKDPVEPIVTSAASGAPAGSPRRFDPWDAPYFGGVIYFSYSPALPDRPVQTTAAPLASDAAVPEPSSQQPEPAPGATVAENQPSEQAPVTSDPAGPRKRNWWAHLFGQS